MAINRISAGVLVFIMMAMGIFSGCDPDVETTTPALTTTPGNSVFSAVWCQETVSKFKDSQPGKIPDNLTAGDSSKAGGEFDTGKYFTVLTHLSMEEGYLLDWVYNFGGSGGGPILYIRPANAAPFKIYEEFGEATNTITRLENDFSLVWFVAGEETGVSGNKIKIDGTKEGYFEYTVLQILGSQFYLFWHANYNDTRIVCEAAALERVLESIGTTELGAAVDSGFKKDAREIDLQPTVEISGDTVTVNLVAFSKWGGFSRNSYTMYKSYPHTVIGFEKEALLEYQCGIMF